MQPNIDISPIISPKSNFSGSFLSPKDNLISNIIPKKLKINTNLLDVQQHKIETPSNKEDLEASNRNNDSATNESYSMDRIGNGGKIRIKSINYY